jgi:hypothetical protein
MAIVVGIDGTGSAFFPGARRDAQYDCKFKDSFVRRLAHTGKPDHKYFRGPVVFGYGLRPAIRKGYAFIIERLNAGAPGPVLLTGFSRGAAGVVAIAAKLKKSRIPVHAMLLFDCVGRHPFIFARTIPNNVEHVLHVMRDSCSGSRRLFGNACRKHSPPTIYTCQQFRCTHGAMGGTPWPVNGHSPDDRIRETFSITKTRISYAEDRRVSEEVWNFVQQFATAQGFRD